MAEDWITDEVVKDAACWPNRRLGEPRGVDRASFDRWLARVRAEAVKDHESKRIVLNIDPAPRRDVLVRLPCPRCGF